MRLLPRTWRRSAAAMMRRFRQLSMSLVNGLRQFNDREITAPQSLPCSNSGLNVTSNTLTKSLPMNLFRAF